MLECKTLACSEHCARLLLAKPTSEPQRSLTKTLSSGYCTRQTTSCHITSQLSHHELQTLTLLQTNADAAGPNSITCSSTEQTVARPSSEPVVRRRVPHGTPPFSVHACWSVAIDGPCEPTIVWRGCGKCVAWWALKRESYATVLVAFAFQGPPSGTHSHKTYEAVTFPGNSSSVDLRHGCLSMLMCRWRVWEFFIEDAVYKFTFWFDFLIFDI